MDSFDSKDFYGFSLLEDPKLRTTTRNYEFKFNSSDRLERIINRVKMDREKSKQSFRNLSAPFVKPESLVLSKTSNVETEIGRSSYQNIVVKVMTNKEIEAMISQALHSTTGLPIPDEKSESIISLGEVPESMDKDIAPKMNEQPTTDVLPDAHQIEAKVPISSVEMLSNLQPHWVEIKPIQKASVSSITDSRTYTQETTESEDVSALNLANENLDIDELKTEPNEDKLSDIVSFKSFLSEDFVIRNNESPRQIEAESPPVSLMSFGIESPLNNCELDEMERILGKALPYVPEMEFGNVDSPEDSEFSEYPDDQDDDDVNEETICSENIEQHVQPIIRIQQIERHPKPLQTPVQSPCTSDTQTARSSRPVPRSTTLATPPISKESAPEKLLDRRMKKQIEVLKHEKIRIFSKMTSIQEKIIEILDKLRMNLLELSLPDGNVEQRLRERNAFEFSVRFSRNYLFPLGRMIEDLRMSPKENYCSATTNEPCIKVCGIYGLLSQALDCYHKQLRHFFTDSVPKKLDVLINMIMDATNFCLDKKIFDKRDTLIQCLLLRCSGFLEFVMKFAEEKKTAREEVLSVRSGRRDQLRLSKTSSKWDLTMNLNTLNMYEPKLVAKKPKTKTPKRTMQSLSFRATLKSKKLDIPPTISKIDDKVMLPAPDPVDTQVRKLGNTESLQRIKTALDEEPEGELPKCVIETLQDITKNEVRQMLEPIISNMDTILANSDTPQTVESVLDVLNLRLLARCKQLNIDAAATENITQNGNTYQKEVTKKGANSTSKENRQRRVSKTKATSSSNNVKEGSTEQTKRYNSCGGRTDTICDKQSLSNIDVVAVVDKNDSMKQKTRSRSSVGGGGAFLSTAAANKPTPALATNRIGIPPPSLAIAVSPVQLDEVMPSLPVQQSKWMTSQCLEHSASLPMELPVADGFTPEGHRIENGEYRKEIAPQRKVRDGDDANAFDKPEESQEARRRNPPSSSSSSAKNGTAMSGQMKQLNYSRNALYTFVKYREDDQPIPEVHAYTNEIESKRITAEMSPRSVTLSPKPSQNDSFKSVPESNNSLTAVALKQPEKEIKNDEAIKELLEQRTNFIEQCKNNPLYTNPHFPQPWKVLSKISHSIAREIVGNFEDKLSFGEESYIQDFINMELQT